MKILVTGGSGFIGHNIMIMLKGQGHCIMNVDIKAPPQKEFLPYWRELDLLNVDLLKQCVLEFNPEIVLHLAARTDLEGKTIEDYALNTSGVENLLDACALAPNLKRLMVTSSMLVCKAGYIPVSDYDFQADTIYGQSKVITEQVVRNASLPFTWFIVRPTSIWGPWFGTPYRNFFDLVLSRKFFCIGARSSTKTFGYIGNTLYQIDKLLQCDQAKVSGKVFYLGDPAVNIDAWASCICELAQLPKPRKMPYPLIKFAAYTGDLLKIFGIKFPLTSFRLRNMTISYEMNLLPIEEIASSVPFSLNEGILATLTWLKEGKN